METERTARQGKRRRTTESISGCSRNGERADLSGCTTNGSRASWNDVASALALPNWMPDLKLVVFLSCSFGSCDYFLEG
ncbi:hypothetical protein TNCT_215991 [Trichonephila clavata]|uniref:Uncharacterized protein n=1 Tax=Trichonephila clavata TaxID=2740835 RepID=A0A8X6JDF1_TRICU|nr:hypothetical protein TNCT_518451 [Trichonephila clavata]GFR24609.1 hypothetical protein TNCT_215991 [Trichonephila clavata]